MVVALSWWRKASHDVAMAVRGVQGYFKYAKYAHSLYRCWLWCNVSRLLVTSRGVLCHHLATVALDLDQADLDPSLHLTQNMAASPATTYVTLAV